MGLHDVTSVKIILGTAWERKKFYATSYFVVHEVNVLRHIVWVPDPNSQARMQIFNVEI